MHISKVKVYNFRLLKESVLDLEDQEEKNLSLLIGKNNSGKTSFIMMFDKFLKASSKFNFDDFSLKLRKQILDINEETNTCEISIKLIIEITYSDNDSLKNLSDLILDLDPDQNKVKILFECQIDKQKILADLINIKDNRERFIKKELSNYLISKIYVFHNDDHLDDVDRSNFIEKDINAINSLINFQVIHAKRSVASSESNSNSGKVLSSMASSYFNKKSENKNIIGTLDPINSSLLEMDEKLEKTYEEFFNEFLNKSKDFLGMEDLKVVSNLESNEILSHHSKIVYGSNNNSLPEHLNGLGYMNILYLLLQLEIKAEYFKEGEKEINILFIEEPEAHTHPQMQTVFIEKIKVMLDEILHLQTFITTHSAHIVKSCDFKDIRYLFTDSKNQNIIIKNFHSELKVKYSDKNPDKNVEEAANFKFMKQYLTIGSAELFFAEKIIFIEGLTERLLLPYLMNQFDKTIEESQIKLSSQNISILEVGANAKAFRHFIDFLDIKTLIITDIDTTKKNTTGSYEAHPVNGSTHTSNASIRYFLQSPEFKEEVKFKKWFESLKNDKLQDKTSKVKLSYQTRENGYHGRSFEEAFISVNIQNLLSNVADVKGLKPIAKEQLKENKDFDDLTKKILDKKSEFASSILWLALTQKIQWNMPNYIKNGLVWIAKN